MRDAVKLTDQQIEKIVAYQREHRTRFGEAAVALKMASREEVLQALARQFKYSYTPTLTSTGAERYKELIVATNPFGDGAEAFRELRSQLLMGVLNRDGSVARRALAVVSHDAGDGKTYVAANLAVALSQLGDRTLLLDADMRTPRMHQVCDVPNNAGLSNVLSGRTDRNVLQQMRDLPGLFVLPVGGVPPNPLELVQRPVFGLLLHELLMKFDHVIVDTPAVSHGADAGVIAHRAGAALLVGRKDHSKMKVLQKLAGKLGRSQVAMAGLVINEW